MTAHYRNKDREQRSEAFEIDPREFLHALVGGLSWERQQSESIKKIADVLGRSSSLTAIRVNLVKDDKDILFLRQDRLPKRVWTYVCKVLARCRDVKNLLGR